MVKDPIRSHEHNVGETSVRERTGRTREEWFALLDEVGAAGWPHKRIAAWLGEEHGVDGWWCQSLAVGYGQARGLRAPGQRSDGTWEAGASITVRAVVDEVFTWVSDPGRRSQWLDAEVEVRGETPGKSVRWTFDDGTRVEVRLTALPDTAAGPRTRVTVAHRGLAGTEDVGVRKVRWREHLGRLKDLVATGG